MGEDKKPKKLSVVEIQKLEPRSETYELNSHCKYLIMIPKSNLVGGQQAAYENAREIMQVMKAYKLPCAILMGVDEQVKFFELGMTYDTE